MACLPAQPKDRLTGCQELASPKELFSVNKCGHCHVSSCQRLSVGGFLSASWRFRAESPRM